MIHIFNDTNAGSKPSMRTPSRSHWYEGAGHDLRSDFPTKVFSERERTRAGYHLSLERERERPGLSPIRVWSM